MGVAHHDELDKLTRFARHALLAYDLGATAVNEPLPHGLFADGHKPADRTLVRCSRLLVVDEADNERLHNLCRETGIRHGVVGEEVGENLRSCRTEVGGI